MLAILKGSLRNVNPSTPGMFRICVIVYPVRKPRPVRNLSNPYWECTPLRVYPNPLNETYF